MSDDFDPAALSPIRQKMLDLAGEAVGLGITRRRAIRVVDGAPGGAIQTLDGAPGDGYLSLIADGETASMARAMGAMSGCALVVRGLWRLAGFDDARLVAPYQVGTAVELLFAMAREAGAVVTLEGGAEPTPGDVFLLTTPQEHVATFVRGVDMTDGRGWFSVDGGQRDVGGGELITNVRRRRNGNTLDGRTLGAVIDLDCIALRFLPGDR